MEGHSEGENDNQVGKEELGDGSEDLSSDENMSSNPENQGRGS